MIIFRPELAEKVLDGSKTVTRRRVNRENPRAHWHRDQVKTLEGKRRAVVPGRAKHGIGWVTVAGVEFELFYPASIDDAEAQLEGFADAAAFKATWLELHGHVQPVEVWRVELINPERKEPADG